MSEWFGIEVCRRGNRRLKGIFTTNMTLRAYFLDFFIYPPMIVICLVMAFERVELNLVPGLLTLVLAGYVAWTLIEYLIHRFVLHHMPLLKDLHGAHHDTPTELIGTPTIFSAAAFYFLAYWPVVAIWGTRPSGAFLVGLLGGYLSYAFVHYALHHLGSGRFPLMKRLKRHHALHHHVLGGNNFGVTTGVWDTVFGTSAK